MNCSRLEGVEGTEMAKSEEKPSLRGLAMLYHPPFWEFGGSERRFAEISSHLKKFNIHFDAIETYPPVRDLLKADYTPYVIKLSRNMLLNFIGWLLLGTIRIFSLKPRQYNFIYITTGNLPNLTLGLLTSRIFSIPSIAVVHHLRWVNYEDKDQDVLFDFKKTFSFMRRMGLGVIPSLFRAIGSLFESYLLKKVDVCITVSQTVAEQLHQLGCKSVVVSGNGIRVIKDTKNIKNTPKKPYVIYIGRFDEGKGVLEILIVWKLIEKVQPDAKLLLVGKGCLYEKARKLARKLNLRHVYFLRNISDEKLSLLMSHCKVFLTLSRIEGFCFSIGEALAHNLPVVCFDIPVLREVYGHCSHIHFVRLGDLKCAADLVIHLIRREYSAHETEPRECVKSFSWEEVSKKEYVSIKTLVKYYGGKW